MKKKRLPCGSLAIKNELMPQKLLKLGIQKRMFRSLRIFQRRFRGVRRSLKLLQPGSPAHKFHSLRKRLDRFSLP